MTQNPLERLSELLLTVTTIPVLAMMIHVTLDVAMKYAISAPIFGTLEITANYYMVAIVLLPMAFIEMTRQSIAVDLFYQMMPEKMTVVVTGFVLLLCAAGYGGLAWISWPEAMASYAKNEISMGSANIYIWPSRFLLPGALALTTVVCLYHFVRLVVSAEARAELIAIHQVDPESEVV